MERRSAADEPTVSIMETRSAADELTVSIIYSLKLVLVTGLTNCSYHVYTSELVQTLSTDEIS